MAASAMSCTPSGKQTSYEQTSYEPVPVTSNRNFNALFRLPIQRVDTAEHTLYTQTMSVTTNLWDTLAATSGRDHG